MKKIIFNKLPILILTVCLFAVAARMYISEESKWKQQPSLRVKADSTFMVNSPAEDSSVDNTKTSVSSIPSSTNEIEIWYESRGDKYYLFVPAYSDLEHTVLELADGVRMYLDGKELKSGDNLSSFDFDTEYSLLFSNMPDEMSLILKRNGGVATLYLDTASGSMDYLKEDEDHKESGNMTLITEDGLKDYSGKVSRIKGHGNTSWRGSPKKPLSLKLSSEADLLGMGASRKWVLLNNYNELTNLNNKLIYEFADDIGLAYSPDCELVDTYINGVYYGLYLLSEKIEIAESRVDVAEPTNQAGGSYLVDMTFERRAKESGEHYVLTTGGYCLRVVSPGDTSSELEEEIRSDFQSLENALYSEDGIDPDTGKSWDEIIDLDSWVRKYLVEEIVNGVDTARVSQYFYKTGEQGDDKIYAGPVWDYNSALGNKHSGNPIQDPVCLRTNRKTIGKLDNWFYYLYHQEKFYNRMVEIYEEEFLPVLNELITEKMPAFSEKISDSSHSNFIRWKNKVEGYTNVEDEYETEHKFLEERVAYLTSDWVDGEDYSYISTYNPVKGFASYHSVPTGELFTEDMIPRKVENVNGKTLMGWFDQTTDEPYDFSQPVTEEYLYLYGKWE